MTIHIKIEDVERLRAQLRRAGADIEQSVKSVQDTLERADWRDQNRAEFERAFAQARARVAQFAADAQALDQHQSRVITQAKQLRG
jgi:hypothetical protein